MPDVAQRDRADERRPIQGDPESAAARLVEVGDVQQVRLIVHRHAEAELLALDGQDEVDDG